MGASLWQLTEEHAVVYAGDRDTLRAILAYARFPHRDLSRATTYHGRGGRAVGWQFVFPLPLWNGVVRHLGRESVTYPERESSRAAAGSRGGRSRSPAPTPPEGIGTEVAKRSTAGRRARAR